MKIQLNKTIGAPKYPTKNTINLLIEEKNVRNPKVQIAIFVIFLLLLGIFVKFMVIDKLGEAFAAQKAYEDMQGQIAQLKEINDGNKEIKEKYAHYGYGYLNEEEKAEQDRMEMLALIKKTIISKAEIQSVDISENVATISIDKIGLKTVSGIVADLERDEAVSFVTVSTAGTGTAGADVSATMVINFKEKAGEKS